MLSCCCRGLNLTVGDLGEWMISCSASISCGFHARGRGLPLMSTNLAEERATKPPAKRLDESFIVVWVLARDDCWNAVCYASAKV